MQNLLKSSLRALPLQFLTLVVSTLLLSSLANANDKFRPTNKFNLGIGANAHSGVYYGQDTEVELKSFTNIYLDGFFIKEETAGFEVINYKSVALALAIRRGDRELIVDDLNDEQQGRFSGIVDRERAIEAGVIGSYYSPVGLIEGKYFRDVSGKSKAGLGELRISRPLEYTGDFDVHTGLFINYYSGKYNRYYFQRTDAENEAGFSLVGVSRPEFDNAFPIYFPGNSAHVGIDLFIQYNFSDSFAAALDIKFEDITGEWEGSSLVEEKGMLDVAAGLVYKF